MTPEALAKRVAERFTRDGTTLAVAESCTGGLLAGRLTSLPGASRFFWGGVVAYANEAKVRLLGVRPATLARFGAVSSKTAREMAIGVAALSKADCALSITGIAGPGGSAPGKPVGLVYFAVYRRGRCAVDKKVFSGSRTFVREQAVRKALTMLGI